MKQKGSYTLSEKAAHRGVTVLELVQEAVLKRGSIEGAARELDVGRNTIVYHLNKAGIRLTTTVSLEKVG